MLSGGTWDELWQWLFWDLSHVIHQLIPELSLLFLIYKMKMLEHGSAALRNELNDVGKAFDAWDILRSSWGWVGGGASTIHLMLGVARHQTRYFTNTIYLAFQELHRTSLFASF